MNGEIYQIAYMTAAVKYALHHKIKINYTPSKHEGKSKFKFLSAKFNSKTHKAHSVTGWYRYCVKHGLEDVKLLLPTTVHDPSILGFSNTSEGSLACFYANGKTTYFTANWKFNTVTEEWDIYYTENSFFNEPVKKPRFENNTNSFLTALYEIKDLAQKIGCDYFVNVFDKARNILLGDTADIQMEYDLPLPQIPKENLRLFQAASVADVFGAMGSWNDEPPYMAHEKGLDKEYEELSAKLLRNIRCAILYAINEW